MPTIYDIVQKLKRNARSGAFTARYVTDDRYVARSVLLLAALQRGLDPSPDADEPGDDRAGLYPVRRAGAAVQGRIPQVAGEAYLAGLFDLEKRPTHEWDNRTSKENFSELWDRINAARNYGWDANPWVWALTFEVIRANVDQVLREAA